MQSWTARTGIHRSILSILILAFMAASFAPSADVRAAGTDKIQVFLGTVQPIVNSNGVAVVSATGADRKIEIKFQDPDGEVFSLYLMAGPDGLIKTASLRGAPSVDLSGEISKMVTKLQSANHTLQMGSSSLELNQLLAPEMNAIAEKLSPAVKPSLVAATAVAKISTALDSLQKLKEKSKTRVVKVLFYKGSAFVATTLIALNTMYVIGGPLLAHATFKEFSGHFIFYVAYVTGTYYTAVGVRAFLKRIFPEFSELATGFRLVPQFVSGGASSAVQSCKAMLGPSDSDRQKGSQ